MIARRLVRSLPPVKKRDAQLRELRAELRQARARLEQARPPAPEPTPAPDPEIERRGHQLSAWARPSWHGRLEEQRRVQAEIRSTPARGANPRSQLMRKLRTYELARSHGVATPRVLGIWPTVEEIAFAELPESFVLKSDRGAGGHGVFPLRRSGEDFELVDGTATMSAKEIREHYRTRRGPRPPFFAEDLLPGSEAALPDDVKIYSYYGEIGHVFVRRMPEHKNLRTARSRFFGADGSDLGQVLRSAECDPTIAPPTDFESMVSIARVLSTAVPLPFVRVDLYQVEGGVMLGELTPLPGATDRYTDEHDAYLGSLYDAAEARLQSDLVRGRPFTRIFGPHDADVTVPMAPTASYDGSRPAWSPDPAGTGAP